MQRDCPRCWQPLAAEKQKRGLWNVTIDLCSGCGGLFLDRGELLRLTGNRPLHHLTTKHLGIDSDSQLLCPGCGGIMDAEHAAGIEFDVCLSCSGVWLDPGELEALQAVDAAELKELSPEKLAELYDAGQAVPGGGLLAWLFRR